MKTLVVFLASCCVGLSFGWRLEYLRCERVLWEKWDLEAVMRMDVEEPDFGEDSDEPPDPCRRWIESHPCPQRWQTPDLEKAAEQLRVLTGDATTMVFEPATINR